MHVDMDAFYASVEVRYRPELRGRPVIVGGFPRGVVLSATYEARALGIRSGMSSPQARRLAPRATFVDPNFERYGDVSKAIGTVFRSVTAVVEAASIDEAFLDLTGSVSMFGPPAQIGEHVRAVVADEQQITCSVGIGPTKFVAKMASRAAKPDGLARGGARRGRGVPAPDAGGGDVGRRSADRREAAPAGGADGGGPARTPRGTLRRTFGPHAGAGLVELAWGRDSRRVVPQVPERSVGSQQTFAADSSDRQVIRRELLRMADRTASRMRKQQVLGRTVSISVRFADFTEVNRSATVPSATDVDGGDLRRGARTLRPARAGPRPDPAGRGPGGAAGRRLPRVSAASVDRPRVRLAGGRPRGRPRRTEVRVGSGASRGPGPDPLTARRIAVRGHGWVNSSGNTGYGFPLRLRPPKLVPFDPTGAMACCTTPHRGG